MSDQSVTDKKFNAIASIAMLIGVAGATCSLFIYIVPITSKDLAVGGILLMFVIPAVSCGCSLYAFQSHNGTIRILAALAAIISGATLLLALVAVIMTRIA